MATIYQYQKVIDAYTTHMHRDLDYEQMETDDRITELCTIDGITYISVPNALSLPEQPNIIQKSLKTVSLTSTLKNRIRENSPTLKLTADRMSGKEPEVRYSKENVKQLNNLKEFFDKENELTAHITKWRGTVRNVIYAPKF